MKRLAIAVAIALAISPTYAASMWDAGNKLAEKEVQMKLKGKTEAEAKACTDKAWKAAQDLFRKDWRYSVSDTLDALLDNKDHASAIEECRDRGGLSRCPRFPHI